LNFAEFAELRDSYNEDENVGHFGCFFVLFPRDCPLLIGRTDAVSRGMTVATLRQLEFGGFEQNKASALRFMFPAPASRALTRLEKRDWHR
jgi:hypothetical protein